MYVKLQDGQPLKFPYNMGELRRDNPGTSFPNVVSDSTLIDYDVYPVVEVPAPTVDNRTHRLAQWVNLVDGLWTQTWQIEPLPETQAADNIRSERNQRLAECDWTQLPDAPVDAAAWATYRQALRDISSQPGFPWNVQWPVKP